MTGAASDVGVSFGALLRLLRERAGLSQEELAAQAEVSVKAIGALERGERRRPYPATVRRLADALGLADAERAAFIAAVASRGSALEPAMAGVIFGPPAAARAEAIASAANVSSLAALASDVGPDHALAVSGHSGPRLHPAPLPSPLTPLIGREAARTAVHAALATARLVTLTGVGGTGKTRLALQVAQEAAQGYPDGVAFTDLAPVHDPALLASAIGWALGLSGSAALPAEEHLQEALRTVQLLLVVDNVEHLLESAHLLTRLLAAAPGLRILATSRIALRLYGEREIRVPPLRLPQHQGATDEDVAASEAVQLFIQRAQAVRTDFAPRGETLRAVCAICMALDGLPLAIELAAARTKLFTPEAVLPRLSARLGFLIGGPRDLPGRQQTLRAALDWSYALLAPAARRLFARLGVFASPFDATEAAAVCGVGEGGVDDSDGLMVERLGELADQSLLEVVPDPVADPTPRFRLLQTVREYALARLAEAGEEDATRARHLAYYVALAEQAAPELVGLRQAAWLDRLDRAHADLQAALRWAREHGQVASGLRLAGALVRFWRVRGYGGEGLDWLMDFISHTDDMDVTVGTEGVADSARAEVPAAVRARAVFGAGMLANGLGDQQQAVRWLERAGALYREIGEPLGALHAASALAGVAYDQGKLREALARYEECAALAGAAHDEGELARALGNMGEMYYHLGDLPQATRHYEKALAAAQRSGRVEVEAGQLGNLGNVALRQGDLRRAGALHRQALELKRVLGYRRQIAITLEDLAALAVAEGQMERAAHLLGAASELRATIGSPQPVPERRATDQAMAGARAALGEAAWAAALAAGRTLPLERVIADSLG